MYISSCLYTQKLLIYTYSYLDALSNALASFELQQHLRDPLVCGELALSLHHSLAFEI